MCLAREDLAWQISVSTPCRHECCLLPAAQLVISYCTKRTPRMRTLEMALFNAQTQQHGRPTPEHWRRVMVGRLRV